ncbi:uncharacterized protein EDB91DRAFT_1077735 [Suillus paluster]|uniref:uncharacterized protein n=1 Tax=Suillus paluster TaxID=48578 RepID=UPI001B876323|nr:uncharacterized protein EDB91DRAFT_1077735 [Suillus paluster]KAG1752300.1 hypothetical protein EDB91DRAFT_1077735 [Suillus paluster]
MSQDTCVLNADGSLKDASDITFFNDPDDNVPLPQVSPSTQPSTSTASTRNAYSVLLKAGHTPATVAAGSWRSGRPSKPSARIRDADNACRLSSSSGTRKCALSSATDHLAPKKVAMQLLPPLDSEDEDEDEDIHPGESSADELVPQPDVEELDDTDDAKSENGVATQTLSKNERTADVRTIFTRIPDGWVCTLCKDAGEPAHKHTFRGGTSTLRTHIVRHKRTHFQVYKQRCDAASITMHSRAIPPGEDHLTVTQSTLDANLVSKPPMFTKEGLLEYIMELVVTEDEVHQVL